MWRILPAVVLVSTLILTPDAAQGQAADDGEATYQALVRDHDAARKALAADPKAGSDLDRWNALASRFSTQAMELAHRYQGQRTALKALTWIVDRSDDNPRAEEALRILTRDHARDPAIGIFCRYLFRTDSKAAEELFRRVIAENPERTARAQASYTLACNLASLADSVRQQRLNPRTGGFLGPAPWLRGRDPDALDREAESLLKQIVHQYADVKDDRGLMGNLARAELDAIQNLAVGKKAPEIEGEDLDGRPMKLSDYRGKVIVLDFMSHEYCGPCRAMYPSERALVARLKGRPFALLGVNCDDHRDLVKKAREQGEITWRSWWDGGSTQGPIATRWNIPGWPTVFVLDHHGVIRYKGMLFDGMDASVAALLRDYDREQRAASAPATADLPASIDFDQAVRAAAAIPYEVMRVALLVDISNARAKAGDRQAAQALLRECLEQVRKASDSSKDADSKASFSIRLASLQDRVGDRAGAKESLARAIEAAKVTPQENNRFDMLQFAARTQAELGDFAGAMNTTRAALSSSGMNTGWLADIAREQAQAGDVAGALETSAKIRALAARNRTRKDAHPMTIAYEDLILAEALAEIAMAQAKLGEVGVADARKTLRNALDLVDRSLKDRSDVGAPALARIALAQAKLGDREASRKSFERARQATENLGAFPAAEILAKIAEARWKAGDLAEARAILREAFERSGPLDNQFPQVNDIITQVQLDVGDFDGALQTARASVNELGELVLSADVVRRLVRAHAATIGPRAALTEWLKSARSPSHRAHAILGAAEAAAAATAPKPPVQP
jgi:thiol-disulfide isomerase/thioredoxin